MKTEYAFTLAAGWGRIIEDVNFLMKVLLAPKKTEIGLCGKLNFHFHGLLLLGDASYALYFQRCPEDLLNGR